MKYFIYSLSFLFFSSILHSQVKDAAIQKVIDSYDLKKLNELETFYNQKYIANMQKAKEYAKAHNLPLRKINSNGSVDELVGIEGDDFLLYNSIDNANAAISTRANILNNTYNLKGANMTVGVWDGGPARNTHVEFNNRLSIGDGNFVLNENSFHATHVSGTIGAFGINAAAKGMAPSVNIKSFDWFNDESEVINQAALGLLISNHSYGVPLENAPAWLVGAYSSAARDWDVIAYNAPYYLAVYSAGNNGGDINTSASSPGLDKLIGEKAAKNDLVVANAEDAAINATGDLVGVNINSSSSQGPADDRRIKPDIAGNGSGLLSTGDATNTSYLTLSGTSMASPNVAGSLILVQEYFKQKYNRYMKAATLKGLACHTADDAGNPGPDAKFGWGLLNCKKAVETILFNGLSSLITESSLNQGQTKTYTFASNGTTPLSATICWTDVPGQANNGINNSTTPALVNDLDIRITQSTNVFFPWKLQANANLNATRNSDNFVDNVESVKIDAPANTVYTVTVSHKNTLVNNSQNFSLIVTGIQSSFALVPINDDVTVCSTQNAVYNLDFRNLDFDNVDVTASNLPSGAIATFSENPLFADTLFTLTLSNLQNVPAGSYDITINGTKGTEVKALIVKLTIKNTNFANLNYTFPPNNFNNVAQNSVFSWDLNSNATSYVFQVSSDIAFSSFIYNNETTSNQYSVNALNQDQNYYWRVLPKNSCGTATTGLISTFKTGIQTCSNNYQATDFSNATISTGLSIATVPINVPENFTISDLTIAMNITHTAVQELNVYLEAPSSLNIPDILLINQACGNNANIVCNIKDSFSNLICAVTPPAISGNIKPYQSLVDINNKNANGIWKLKVVDSIVGDGGQINSFSLNFCNVSPSLSTIEFDKNKFNIYPNPSSNFINVEFNNAIDNNKIFVFDVQGRNIMEVNVFIQSTIIDISTLQSGVYFIKSKTTDSQNVKRFIKN